MTGTESAPQVRIEMLGQLRAWRGRREVVLGPPIRQAVLSVLAMRANQTILRDEIIDAVWGDEAPPSAVNAVHVHVAALRRAFEPDRRPREPWRVLAATGRGYRLRLAPGGSDLEVWYGHLGRAKALRVGGDVPGAVDAFDTALAMWHGVPLAGVVGPYAEAERLRLGEQRSAAVEDRAEAMLGLGRGGVLIGELSALVSEYPFRERLVGLLMVALYRGGRQAEALAVFATTRRRLVDELGVEPGNQLQRIHGRILAQADADVGAASPSAVQDGTGRLVAPRQLPAVARNFAGRERELDVLNRLLPETTGDAATAVIVAIEGMAGVGKTTLAVHWAHQVATHFPDGQLYVDLRGFHPTGPAMFPAEALRTILDAIGVPAAQIPIGMQAQVALYRSLLAGKRVLVVLDNARDADQVRPLLPGSPGCLAVVTSRCWLAGLITIEAAQPLTLGPMLTRDSHRLLAGRLGDVRMTADPDAVADILTRCAGLPLALALVAAHAAARPHFSLDVVAGQLRASHNTLDSFDIGTPTTGVRAVFSWSYHALDAAPARLFRLLGLHPGAQIAVATAASLAGITAGQAAALLSQLADTHLVNEDRPGRFTVHDLLRTYALELVEATDTDDDRSAARHRLLDHYLCTAYTGALALNPTRDPIVLGVPEPGAVVDELDSEGAALTWFTVEHTNLHAAIDLASAAGFDSHAWRLAWTLMDFSDRNGRWATWRAVLGTALDAAGRADDPIGRAFAHRGLGLTCGRLGDFIDAHLHYQQATALYDELRDTAGLAHCHRGLGWLFSEQNRYQEALEHFQRTLVLYRAADHQMGEARCLNSIGWCYAALGDFEQALAYCRPALALHQRIGDRVGEATTWDSLGYVHHTLGDHAEAIACYRRALGLFRSLGSRYHEGDTLIHLGDTHEAAGAPNAAREVWSRALIILAEFSHPGADQARRKLTRLDALGRPTDKRTRQGRTGDRDDKHRDVRPAGRG